MNRTVALIGNPNSGKTTLFNLLTGTYQKVGNWTGVTVEKKEGRYRRDKAVKVVDLPGLYSLTAFGNDERAVTEYLKKTPPQVIINVVDGTKLERSLNLTAMLAELGIPVVIALNMYDDLQKNGLKPDVKKLSEAFGMPVLPVSALKNKNIDELMRVALSHEGKPSALFKNESPSVRFTRIAEICKSVMKKKKTKAEKTTEKLDAVLTHRFFGIPIFACVMVAVYFVSLKVGGYFGGLIENAFESLCEKTAVRFALNGFPAWFTGLISGAVLKGTGTVISFLPQILMLFFMLTLLEESGYMARVAFILDRFFRAFGLSGKSVIPLILSCGCTVTGLMSARAIENSSEREMTVFLCPFMPCGAKTAVFGWFSYKFFGGSALIAASMYFLGIFTAAAVGGILKKTKAFKDGGDCFILEMPTYRMPSLKDVAMVLFVKVKEFAVKAGTVIFAVSVLLWLLSNFGIHGYTARTDESFLYYIGSGIKYLFVPLGFGNWQASVSVLSGFLAKEAVIETLEVISHDAGSLFSNGFSAYAFMAFILLSPPCAASIAQAKRELVGFKKLLLMLAVQTGCAYVVALAINVAGYVFTLHGSLIFIIVCVIITAAITVGALIKTLKYGCGNCTACGKGEKKCHGKSKRNTTL